MNISVFDVDGCLADTLPLVRRCYQQAGVDPTEAQVRTNWRLWLPDLAGGLMNAERVRAHKAELYLDAVRDEGVVSLPAAKLARDLVAAGDRVLAVTAGNPATAVWVLRALGLKVGLLGTEVLPEERPDILTGVARSGTYYDDDEPTCWRVHAETEWAAIPV